jgi:hypothetical protein
LNKKGSSCPFLVLVFVSLCVGLLPKKLAFAQSQNSALEFQGPTVQCQNLSKSAEWIRAMAAVCRSLGDSLKPHTGPWGLGLHDQTFCQIPGRNLPDPQKKAAENAAWKMQIRLENRTLWIDLFFKERIKVQKNSGDAVTPEATLQLPYNAKTFLLLAQRKFSRFVAAALIDQLAFKARVTQMSKSTLPPVRDPTLSPFEYPGNPSLWAYAPVAYNSDTDAWVLDENREAREVKARDAANADPDDLVGLEVVYSQGRATLAPLIEKHLAEWVKSAKVNERLAPGDSCGLWQVEKPPPKPTPTPPPPPRSPTPTPVPEKGPKELEYPFDWDDRPELEMGGGAARKSFQDTHSSVGGWLRAKPLRRYWHPVTFFWHFVQSVGSLDVLVNSGDALKAEERDRGAYTYQEMQIGLGYLFVWPMPFGLGVEFGPSVHYVSQTLNFRELALLAFSSSQSKDEVYGAFAGRLGMRGEWQKYSARLETSAAFQPFGGKEYQERGLRLLFGYTLFGESPAEKNAKAEKPSSLVTLSRPDLDFPTPNLPKKEKSSLRVWAFGFAERRDVLVAQQLAKSSGTISKAQLGLVTSQTLYGLGLGLGW